MTNTHYLPGDRVRYNADHPGSLHGYRYAVGTLKNPTTLNPSMITIDWDNAHHGKNSDHGFSFIERQPIEPGCWVRELPGENIFSNPGKPVQVVAVHGYIAEFPGFLGGKLHVDVKRLARVAEPKKVVGIGGISFSVGENDMGITTIKAENFIMQSPHVQQNKINRLEGELKNMTEKVHSQTLVIQQAARRLAKWVKDAPAGYGTEESRAWLAANAPELVTPEFKRGDLVTWGDGRIHGRIIGPAPSKDAPFEVIITVSTDEYRLGKFATPHNLRHSNRK
jgi:hypothetical protein